MNAEEKKMVVIEARKAFVASLVNKTIAHGAAVMPRGVWADGIIAAFLDAGIMAPEAVDVEKAQAILGSELGNSSQLGSLLLKDGTLKQQGAEGAAEDYAAKLLERLGK